MTTRRVLLRTVVIGFFIGLNLVLGIFFLRSVLGYELSYVQPMLSWMDTAKPTGIGPSSLDLLMSQSNNATAERIDINSERVLSQINQFRRDEGVDALIEDERLIRTAESLRDWLSAEGSSADQDQLQDMLTSSLEEQQYSYAIALQTAVIGPYTMTQLANYWLNPDSQSPLLDERVGEIGIAAGVGSEDGLIQGITVVVMGAQRDSTVSATDQSRSVAQPLQTRPAVPEITDDAVIEALNTYRQAHKRPPLGVHPNLCQYAEKRVQDLVAHGGLDGHAGFEADFADRANPPAALREYPGNRFGENLAHQFCRNMTTGETFVAESGAALIEWCFDSSTKGHREEQLSTEYTNVCVRHADAMYVVIFGN